MKSTTDTENYCYLLSVDAHTFIKDINDRTFSTTTNVFEAGLLRKEDALAYSKQYDLVITNIFKEKGEKVMRWVNYGDVNYMEHGGIFVKKDTKDFPRCFYVVCLFPDQDAEDTWVIQDLYIDLENVDWVNWEDVQAFAELKETATDVERVIALIDYYAPENFGDVCMVKGRKDVTKTLASFDIPFIIE